MKSYTQNCKWTCWVQQKSVQDISRICQRNAFLLSNGQTFLPDLLTYQQFHECEAIYVNYKNYNFKFEYSYFPKIQLGVFMYIDDSTWKQGLENSSAPFQQRMSVEHGS